jgi:hypothetical protein
MLSLSARLSRAGPETDAARHPEGRQILYLKTVNFHQPDQAVELALPQHLLAYPLPGKLFFC